MEDNKIIKLAKKNKILSVTILLAIVIVLATPIGINSYKLSQYNKFITLGDKSLENENFDEATQYYNEALNYGKSHTDEVNKKLSAIGTIKEAKEIYNQGMKLLSEKKYLEAIEEFKKISGIEKYAKDAQNKIMEASAAYINENLAKAKAEGTNKRYIEAIAILDKILNLDGSNKDALSLKEEYNTELSKVAIDKKRDEEKSSTVKAGNATTNGTSNTNSNTTSTSINNTNNNTDTSSATTYGNTTGNIINGSSTAFDGEFIYFTNSKDGNKIYKVKPNNTGLSKVTNTKGYKISIVGDWIYFIQGFDNPGIYKVKKDGSNTTKICGDSPMSINVVGSWIYYSTGSGEIYKIKVDGTGKAQISNNNFVMVDDVDFVVVGDWIYANLYSKSDGATVLCRMKTDGSSAVKLANHGSHHFVINNGWVYYLSNNLSELNKIKLDGSSKTTVFKPNGFGIYSINISGNYIYFSADNQTATEEHRGIYRINMDGSGIKKLTSTMSKHFSISSNWIYFNTGNENKKVRVDGTGESAI